ncbi:MAG: response regulator [Caldilineaceae bacterium]|nr:response regulator [Caldilineaceae bacterium]
MVSAKKVVLLVESDPLSCELYTRELAKVYDVKACCDSASALRLVQSMPPDLILIEPALAGDDGWGLLAHFKGNPHTMSIPVVICSTIDERRRGMRLGAIVYLVKPVSAATLNEEVHRVLASMSVESKGENT